MPNETAKRHDYNKLVRDNMRQVLIDNGDTGEFMQMPSNLIPTLLESKLHEEIAEYRASPSGEELADILTIVKALAEQHGGMGVIEAIERDKTARRGGFKTGLYLKWATYKERINDN